MDIEWRKIETVKPYPQNAKKHDERQIENVAKSIDRYGWKQPLVIDAEGTVVIGHCRLLAAKKIGLKEVPVIVADDLTEDEIRQLRIVDNKSNESEWDLELLQAEFEEVDLSEFEFDFPEFETIEFDELDDINETNEKGSGFVAKLTFDDFEHYEKAEAELKDFVERYGCKLSVIN